MLSNTAPTFDQPTYTFEVATGTSTIGTVFASDIDGDQISLQSDNTDFYVDASTGAIYNYGIGTPGETIAFNITASDYESSTTIPVTVTFTQSVTYESTQQFADQIIDDEYMSSEDEFYETVEDYSYDYDDYYSEPDYDAALEDSPVSGIDDLFEDELDDGEDYDDLAEETYAEAATEENAANGETNGEAETDPEQEIDPRLQWQAFGFQEEIAFPEATLPVEDYLDDLFAFTPTGTDSFSNTVVLEATPLIDFTDSVGEDPFTAEKETNATTTVTLSQDWTSADEWVVTQSITRYFDSTEEGEHESGKEDLIERTGFTTLTISVINGTQTIVTYTISDSFSYSNELVWDESKEPEEGETTPNSPSGSPLNEEEEEIKSNSSGNFSGGFESSTSMTITVSESLITLPDGRTARQYSVGYGTASSFSSHLLAAETYLASEGNLLEFAVYEVEMEEPTGEEPQLPTGLNVEIAYGGNGSAVDFSGDFQSNFSFATGFGLELQATVADGDSLDDAIVTGVGSYNLSTNISDAGNSNLGVQVQTSTGDRSTGNGAHEYIVFQSGSNNNSSAGFRVGVEFGIDSSEEESAGDADVEFNYETAGGGGGNSKVLYDQAAPVTNDDGSAALSSERLLLNGNAVSASSFSLNDQDGITVSGSSTDSGTTKFKSVIRSVTPEPDLTIPTDGEQVEYTLYEFITIFEAKGGTSLGAEISVGENSDPSINQHLSTSYKGSASEVMVYGTVTWNTGEDGVLLFHATAVQTTTNAVVIDAGGDLTEGVGGSSQTLSNTIDETVIHVPYAEPPVLPESDPDAWLTTVMDRVQLGLDIAGLIPILGEPLDILNAGISLGRGNVGDAMLSIAATNPVGGQAATGAKLIGKASKAIGKGFSKADDAAMAYLKSGSPLANKLSDLKQALNLPCFPAGTPVLTATGWKPIEEIKAGDVVLSRSDQDVNAPVGPQEVQEAHSRVGEVLKLTINGREIQTTTEHPFWVKDKGWVEACDLNVGDNLSTTDNRWIPIDNIQRDGTITTVYNMTVHNWHTYFLGTEDWGFDVWVHNSHGGTNFSVPGPKKTTKLGGNVTEPNLPSKTIANERGVEIVHYTRSGDHGPPHLHVLGGGPETKIGQAGRVLDGSPELTAIQELVVATNKSAIRKAVDQIGRWFRYNNME